MSSFCARLRGSHAVYVATLDHPRRRSILTCLERADVLTVSDQPDFAADGGMLGLVLQETRIVFDANPAAIKETRVSVSSKVLRLARIVETRENGS
jgi:hypothetical protein